MSKTVVILKIFVETFGFFDE